MNKWTEGAISVFKYIIAGYMVLAGAVTMFGALDPTITRLGFIYNTRAGLIIAGLFILAAGATLLYGKIRRSKKWTGIGLFAVYLCFLFAAVLNGFAYDFEATMWVGNAIAAIITGALWLRWKFQHDYVNPEHFKRP